MLTAVIAIAVFCGCAAAPGLSASDRRLQVVTTTGLLRDLVANVGGARVNVVSLVPDGADPHSFEPTLRDVRNVVYADVAFSNYMLLEEHNVIKTLDANLPKEAINVSLAEDAVKYAAEIIPLVENVNLDTIWLGLRARGEGARYGADRSSDVLLSMTAASGPGQVYGYLTGSFGDTDVYFDSGDGFDASDGYKDDTATLPVDAHTHMSWAFTKPGRYRVTFAASLRTDATAKPLPLGNTTVEFAVGVAPLTGSGDRRSVLDAGHADVTADLDRGAITVLYDHEGGGEQTQRDYDPAEVVIEVPAKALAEVPAGPQFRFLGKAGEPLYQLPQAVLGKHVHGEIDPHLWQDVRNAIAYAKLIRDTLIDADPAGAPVYRANAERYLAELDRLDRYVRRTLAQIPRARRQLVTTHDAFAYLAHAYGLKVAGFVTPNPAIEPSLAERRKLSETIRTLRVPAVFLEPNLAARSSTLTEVAREAGIAVCSIYGDAFDARVSTYVQMMRFNADSLKGCLS
ncbi:anchored repeat ABC transporter, substrate-binding protein [Conexibacter sp. JD483]|nr:MULTISPECIES: anchored repeat ABC transporter, substrate-binding protein [unclassified Conexibacter]MDO8183962.1 anchored repeat ABC transporter, substrate-binding protein [Conexibacter sp. CPCC 205706]MDO8196954.1 anchored repeat ABC transporter, substrate-binding protein [Conexibacter sp. CPCC 205762]MDR9369076.1 anchored repeat ABC transporter, substrate-binding protein [Conexibacter sp. JD483]